jgi:hypothetical protein
LRSGFNRAALTLGVLQVNIDDGFLNLMSDNGDSKDDVRVPDGEVGEKITKMFEDGKDVSKYHRRKRCSTRDTGI